MPRKIGPQQIAFFRFELERGDSKRKKAALQDLCALHRKGQFLPAEAIDSFEIIIDGLVLQTGQDLKVVRWCLNALARFGRLRTSSPYVEAALKQYAGNPEIEAAAVAALCHMYRGNIDSIEALRSIDPIIWKLAALQNTDPRQIELSGLNIDIYKADPAVLRLALITVGLNRDIQNLFHPKHSNNAFVRHLGQHDDDVVQQYSVWAVIENSKLAFEDLGVPLDDIEKLKPNVQSKIYQLVSERDPQPVRRLRITELGSFATSDDAREGLAKGIRKSFFDGVEGVTIDWYDQEKNPVICGHLAEHFARFADACGPYEEKVMQINEAEPKLRDRLLLGAEGKPLFSKLKAVETKDLLSGIEESLDFAFELRRQFAFTKALPQRKVIMLAASPLTRSRLRLEQEQRDVVQRIKQLASRKIDLVFEVKTATRTSDILTSLLGSDADIIHFSGHGESAGLVFETADGQAKAVDGQAFASYLSPVGKTLKCVLLNACFSDQHAQAMEPYVNFAVGCNGRIDDDAAITFATAFYVAMASGCSYESSFHLAVNDVRASHSETEAKKFTLRIGPS